MLLITVIHTHLLYTHTCNPGLTVSFTILEALVLGAAVLLHTMQLAARACALDPDKPRQEAW